MAIALMFQTSERRLLLALTLPAFRLSYLSFLILALLLPIIGLFLIDGWTQPGLISVLATAAGLGVVLGLLALEVSSRE